MLITVSIILYFFFAVVYGRFVYRRYTWKFERGDEIPLACLFGFFWPVTMLVLLGLFIGDQLHFNNPK